MTAPGSSKWLEEIREYWSQMTARLADETGQPVVAAPEIGFSALPERPAPVRESPGPPREGPPTRSKEAD